MPERFADAILKYLSENTDTVLKPRQLARRMGIPQEQYDSFSEAVKTLRAEGRVVMGAKNALTLPEMGSKIIGRFRRVSRGFGFVIPDHPNAHGDLYIGSEDTGGAMTGDRVVATVRRRGKRGGKRIFDGKIMEILQRASNRFVGVLSKTEGKHFVLPEGRSFAQPIVIRDVGGAGPKLGAKVVVEIVEYPEEGDLPAGVILETLGEEGELAVETRAVIRSYGLEEEFSPEAVDFARESIRSFDPSNLDHDREDLRKECIITIDPDDARDYDDAISITHHRDGTWTLGVHIADVAHFVTEGSPLDEDASRRSTSTYFPRRVVPMLPEILSNGVCSLQEGQDRLAKSAFIRYDTKGNVLGSRLAETIIRSAKRLTYRQAQSICDGKTGGFSRKIVSLVRNMETLARAIETRRRDEGMIHLDLPDIELVLDDDGKVIDAVHEDTSYSHTIIEMFMVEANEAVARTLTRAGRNFLRRIHPEPDRDTRSDLAHFVRAYGQKISTDLDRKEIQSLLKAVRGRPESFAVNLAVLKTFEQAEYSPMQVGHYALASDCYCHFTSPIRRYPDLTVHRLVRQYCRGELKGKPPEDLSVLTRLGEDCTAASKRAENAERELKEVLVLQFLQSKVGDVFDGVINGVTNFGIFVQIGRFLVDGLIRFPDLGDDWWDVQARRGEVRGESSGKVFRMGDTLKIQIVSVDVARRQLDLLPVKGDKDGKAKDGQKPKSKKHKSGRRSGGGKQSNPQNQSKDKSATSRGKSRKSGGKKKSSAKRKKQSGGGNPKGRKKSSSGKKGSAKKGSSRGSKGGGKRGG